MESNIKKLRTERKISQNKLGEILGVSQQTVSRMEHNRTAIPADVLMCLASYFDVSTDTVLGYEKKHEKTAEILSYDVNIGKDDVLHFIQENNNLSKQDLLLIWHTLQYIRNSK